MAAMKQSQRIAKNAIAGVAGAVIGGAIQLGVIICAARALGIKEFGIYSFVLSFATIFQLLAESGLNPILVREISTHKDKLSSLMGSSVALVGCLSLLVLTGMGLVIPWLHIPIQVKLLAGTMGVAVVALFQCVPYRSALLAHEDNEVVAIGFVIQKILFVLFLWLFLQTGGGVSRLVLAHLLSNLAMWFYYRWEVMRRYDIHPKPSIDWHEWKHLMRHSIAVGGATTLRSVAQEADVILLTWIQGVAVAGLFSGPFRIAAAFFFLPQILSMPLLPVFSRLVREDKNSSQLLETYRRSVKIFLCLGLPFAAILCAGAPGIVLSTLGVQYENAIPTLRLLAITYAPFFVSNLFPILLTAFREHRFLVESVGLAFLIRLGLNLILIPYLSYVGPAVAFLLSECILDLIWVGKLSRMGYHLNLFRMAWRPLLSSLLVSGGIVALHLEALYWLIPAMAVAGLVYLVLLFRMGAFSEAELFSARESMGFLKPLFKWLLRRPQVSS